MRFPFIPILTFSLPCLIMGCGDSDLGSDQAIQLAFTRDAKLLLVVNNHPATALGGPAAVCSRVRSFSRANWQLLADTGELDLNGPFLTFHSSDACILQGAKVFRKARGNPEGGLLFFIANPRTLEMKKFDPADGKGDGGGLRTLAMAGNDHKLICIYWYTTTGDVLPPIVFDVKVGKKTVELQHFPIKGKREAATVMEFSPAGNYIVSCHGVKPFQIQLHAADTGKLVRSLPIDSPVGALRFSPDGKALAALCRDGKILFLEPDLTKKSIPIAVAANQSTRECLAFVGNEYLALFTDTERSKIGLYDLQEWKLRHSFEKKGRWTNCLAGSPDGKLLAAGVPGSVCIWEADSGKLVKELK